LVLADRVDTVALVVDASGVEGLDEVDVALRLLVTTARTHATKLVAWKRCRFRLQRVL
jgi:hypothetical protein